MKFSLFMKLYNEALEVDLDHYIADRGWEDWMDKYVADKNAAFVDTTKIAAILNRIYDLAHMGIKELREDMGITVKAFSQLFEIPYRTIQGWEYENHRTPEYTLHLIAYALFMGDMDDE